MGGKPAKRSRTRSIYVHCTVSRSVEAVCVCCSKAQSSSSFFQEVDLNLVDASADLTSRQDGKALHVTMCC
jgi:hypothetical protein